MEEILNLILGNEVFASINVVTLLIIFISLAIFFWIINSKSKRHPRVFSNVITLNVFIFAFIPLTIIAMVIFYKINLSEPNNGRAENIINLIALSVTTVGVLLACMQLQESIEQREIEDKIKKLNLARQNLKKYNGRNFTKVIKHYAEKNKFIKKRDSNIGNEHEVSRIGLIIEDCWNIEKCVYERYNTFPYLEDIRVQYAGKYKEKRKGNGEFPDPKKGYAENLAAYTDSDMRNLPQYALADTPCFSNGIMQLQIKTGMYFDFFNTCEILNYEMHHESMYDSMPKFKKRGNMDIFDFSNRFAAIGTNTLTVLYNVSDTDNPCFLVHHRSAKNAEAPAADSVIPAGSYQPVLDRWLQLSDEPKSEKPDEIWETVIRKFAEELLHEREYKAYNKRDKEKQYKNELFTNLSGNHKMPLYLMGIGINPQNVKVEILVCAKIDVNQTKLFDSTKDSTKETLAKILNEKNDFTEKEGEYIEVIELEIKTIREFCQKTNIAPPMKEIMGIVYRDLERESKGEGPSFFKQPPFKYRVNFIN